MNLMEEEMRIALRCTMEVANGTTCLVAMDFITFVKSDMTYI